MFLIVVPVLGAEEVAPGVQASQDALANFNGALFFLVLLAVICFVAAIIAVLNKDFGLAGTAFVIGLAVISMTKCVNGMTGTF